MTSTAAEASLLPVDPAHLEAAARERLSPAAYAYYAAGAGAETTLEENVRAWSRWHLRPRVLVDVRGVRTDTTVLGTPVSAPVLLAPCAVNRLADPEAEVAVARAAAAAGTVHVHSSAASIPVREAAAAVRCARWFQLYTAEGRPQLTEERVRAAEEADCSAIVLTVDVPVLGVRYRGFGRWDELDAETRERLAMLRDCPNPGLDWSEIDRLRRMTPLRLVIKGIAHPADARLAAERGVDAIIVSNHGARQLDGAQPTALALPDVVAAVRDGCEVYVDGGVRSGYDVLRALALGARAVLVGRPYLWALALGGEAGVLALLTRLADELRNAMMLAGQVDAGRVDRDIVVANPL